VVLVASVPLIDEPGWRALEEGELLVASNGRIVRPPATWPGRHASGSAFARPASFSPHIAFRIASSTAKPRPSTQEKYHMLVPSVQ
jgi:hypothetical protein